jgi:hypothetical protein
MRWLDGQAARLQRVAHRLEQLFAAVGLAQVVVGAALQRADRGVDADLAAHHDHVASMPLALMKSMISWPPMSGRRRSSRTRSKRSLDRWASASLPVVAVTSW